MGGPIKNYEEQYQRFLVKLRQAREDAGITQVEAARRLDKTQSYVSKCENGDLKVDVIELINFAQAYGKSMTYFLEEIEN